MLSLQAAGKAPQYEGSWAQALNAAGISVCGIDNQGCGRSEARRGKRFYVERWVGGGGALEGWMGFGAKFASFACLFVRCCVVLVCMAVSCGLGGHGGAVRSWCAWRGRVVLVCMEKALLAVTHVGTLPEGADSNEGWAT